MKTKCSKGFIAAVAIIAAVGGYYSYRLKDMNRIDNPANMTTREGDMVGDIMRWREAHGKPMLPPSWNTNPPPPYRANQPPQRNTNQVLQNLGFRQKANELSDAEKVEMTNLFVTKLKPVAEKWASVYGDHVPFSLADLTMDKFVERFGRDSQIYHSYTFVMGDITLGIVEQNGNTAVRYLASKHGLRTMETMSPTGAAPDVSMPVTPRQALALAEADSGVQFPPNEVRLIPSAESGSLAGGAIVDVGSAVKNAMGIPISKTSAGFNYVFAKDGTLAYYLRAH
jgi:hypothetical protein